MTLKNNTKTILFASLIVAMILPFSGMISATAEETGKAIQIQKPETTQAEIDEYNTVLTLVTEMQDLKQNNSDLKIAIENNGETSLSNDDKQRFEQINKRLQEITAEIGTINAESRKLYASTPEVKNQILNAKQIIRDSDIPYHGLGTDFKVGALMIGFKSQEVADQHIPTINRIIDVPYYLEIGLPDDEFGGCATITSNCDPLIGGIKIATQKSSSAWTDCSYSIPAVRNVWWWTEDGFVTAAHCFNGVNGNDSKQPDTSSSKIGEVTKIVWSGECDCAFSKKTGSESTTFGVFSSNTFTSKSDPLNGDWVYMTGYKSGTKLGKVIDPNYDTTTSPSIQNTKKINVAMDNGDSGGPAHDLTTGNVYHGLISSFNSNGGYTAVVPWSHIDNGLNLQ